MRCDGGEDAPRHQEGITSETSQGDIAENIPQGHRRTSDGDYDIQATEESLHRCVVLHGTSSAQTQAIAADLVVAYNHLGMKRLSENDIKGSLRLLQKAQLLTDCGRPFLGSAKRRLRARAVTLNNLGCLMRKWGKPRVGIALLARALQIEASVPGTAENPAGTHLNMSAALSSVGMHRTAAAHAGHAIVLASEAIDACGGRPAEEDASSTSTRTLSEDQDFNCSTLGDDGRGDDEERSPLQIEASVSGTAENPAGTHLNMSTVLSSVGMHRLAAADAGHANILASEVIDACGGQPAEEDASSTPTRTLSEDQDFNYSTLGDDGRGDDEKASLPFQSYSSNKAPPRYHIDDDTGSGQVTVETSEGDDVQENSEGHKTLMLAGSILAIAYFNLAVEREHLGQQQAARAAYEHAKVAADWYLGSKSPVSKGIQNALESTTVDDISTRGQKIEPPRVESFPSIGKLRLYPGSSLRDMRSRDSPSRHSSLLSERQTQDDSTAKYKDQNKLKRAYETPRPFPPPRETKPSRPRRARRRTNWRLSGGAQPIADVGWRCPWGETASENDCIKGDEGLLWRALACSEWGCSPIEARQAQLGGQML